MSDISVKVGDRVIVKDKGVAGSVSFIGTTDFAPGIWIGLTLDAHVGKNDGSVQGKSYFECDHGYGMFVRPANIMLADDETASGQGSEAPSPSPGHSPAKDKSPISAESKLPTLAKKGIPTPGSIAKSRLPTPGTGPTGGRSPSFTNLKTGIRRESTAPNQTALQRERSFVEKNFVETLKQPQVQVQQPQSMPMTPPPSAAMSKINPASEVTSSPSLAAQVLSERLEEKVANIQTQQELSRAKDEIQDLKEKLETIKIKRAKDQEKIKEYEKIRIQHEQLVEFKSRIMEAHSALQKELAKAKHDAREAIEAKERHAEEMSELSETVEMATLDKEMAEERAETLQLELEAAKEKIEELQLDLDIIKAEMGEEGGEKSESATTSFEMKQLNAQNEKLRDTLVKMRDLAAHEKTENIRLTKDLEESQHQVTDLTRTVEKLKIQNETLETTIADLQEQVDAALGAEEMVENLTTKCLDLEDQLAALVEEKQDLEALHDMNEELQENAREMELELREELDLVQAKVREAERARNTAYEIVADHETTIQKFRSLVSQVQEQNQSLRDALEKETNKPVAASSATAEMIDFKKMFAETKAHSRAIDMELRQCEVEEARRHVKMLFSFMSDNFMSRGGDNEAILILLLIPRMNWKISILEAQVKEKFVSAFQVDAKLTKGSGSTSSTERLTFGQSLLLNLNFLTAVLQQYETALNTCDPQTLLRIGTLYPEMSVHEKSVDFYIELLRKDQLDENVPLENLEKSLNYFQQIYLLHLASEKIDHGKLLNNHLKVFSSVSDCLSVGISIAKSVSHSIETYDGEIGSVFKSTENDVAELRQLLKTIKRRLPHQQQMDNRPSTEPVIVFPMSTAKDLTDATKSLSHLAKAFHLFGRSCIQQSLLMSETDSGIPKAKLSEFLHHALDQAYEMGTDVGMDLIKGTLSGALQKLTAFNKSLQDGEFDMDPAAAVALWNTVPPIVVRAESYKTELKDAETLKYKLENKELDIRDLKKALKAKSDELSEMQIRKDKAEKRLNDAVRDGELVREKLQRKLDDAQALLRRKEKEFEETLDHLQTELDSLESERGELRNKLKETTKKVLLEGISRQGLLAGSGAASLTGSGAVSIGPSVSNPVKDSPLLLQHVQELQMAVMSLKEESYRRQGQELKDRLAKLKPLQGPKRLVRQEAEVVGCLATPEMSEKRDISKEESPSVENVSKRVLQLRQEIARALVSKNVVDLSNKNHARVSESENPAADQFSLVGQILRDKKLEQETEKLRMEVVRLMASKKPGGLIDSDFCKFPSPGLCRALSEKDYQLVGRIRISGVDQTEVQKVPLLIGSKDLHIIHQKVIS